MSALHFNDVMSDFNKMVSRYSTFPYLLEDYINVMRNCRRKKPFDVTLMETSDFVGCSKMENHIVNRKVDTSGNKTNWMRIREIMLKREDPFKLYIKSDHNDEAYVTVDLRKKQQGRPSNSNFYGLFEPLRPKGKTISPPKLEDLKSMLHLIPSDAKHFYHSLIADEQIIDDIEGSNGIVDFEEDTNDQ